MHDGRASGARARLQRVQKLGLIEGGARLAMATEYVAIGARAMVQYTRTLDNAHDLPAGMLVSVTRTYR